MVPVTTKPYLNSAIFIIIQQGIPAFFLIKKKTNQNFISCENLKVMRYVSNSGTSFYGIIRLTLQTYSDLQVIHFVRFQRELLIRLTNIIALCLKYLSLIIKGGFLLWQKFRYLKTDRRYSVSTV